MRDFNSKLKLMQVSSWGKISLNMICNFIWLNLNLANSTNTFSTYLNAPVYQTKTIFKNHQNYRETDLKMREININIYYIYIAMAKGIWAEAGWPSGHRFGRGMIHGTPASPVLFFINRTSIGCGPSNCSMAARIYASKMEYIFTSLIICR